MVIGGYAHLGFFVNFFSFPVLVGYLNGIALSIIAGPLGKILGVTVTSRDFVLSLLELSEHLGEPHPLTLILGTVTLALLVLVNYLEPRAPAALIALAFAGGGLRIRHGKRGRCPDWRHVDCAELCCPQ